MCKYLNRKSKKTDRLFRHQDEQSKQPGVQSEHFDITFRHVGKPFRYPDKHVNGQTDNLHTFIKCVDKHAYYLDNQTNYLKTHRAQLSDRGLRHADTTFRKLNKLSKHLNR